MTNVAVEDAKLVVEVQGWHKLQDESYSTLIIEVADPSSAVSNIELALFHAHHRIQ
jgi:uncharacterized protein (DUF1778 family)